MIHSRGTQGALANGTDAQPWAGALPGSDMCSLERCQGKPEKPGPAGPVTGEGVRNRLGSDNKVQAMSLQSVQLKMQTEAELKAQANNRDLSVITGLSHNTKIPKTEALESRSNKSYPLY